MKTALLLSLLALSASARAETALLSKETTPAYTPSMRWSWCKVFADRVELTAETDGKKDEPVTRPARYGAAVKDLAALKLLIAASDAPAPAKTVTTDSGEVRHFSYIGDKAVTLQIRGDSEADNPTAAAKTLVAFLDSNCGEEAEAESNFPDYLSWSCSFQSANGSQSLSFKPAEGAAEAKAGSVSGDYAARCEPLKANKAACSLTDASGRVLARKVFDALGGQDMTIEAEPSLRLTCRANS